MSTQRPDTVREIRRALACLTDPGDATLAAAIAQHGPEHVWSQILDRRTETQRWTRRLDRLDLAAVNCAENRAGARFVIPGDTEWPHHLAVLTGCPPQANQGGEPIGLWVRGPRNLDEALHTSIAITGSRASTAYGDRTAATLAAALTAAGHTVAISAGYGIATAAARATLTENGCLVAFTAGGIDQPYPTAHTALFNTITSHGAVATETPPGTRPTRATLLACARLLAAGTCGTVLIEAAERATALTVTTWAHACHRPVMAVPGPIDNPTSHSPHRLIRDQLAHLVATADDITTHLR